MDGVVVGKFLGAGMQVRVLFCCSGCFVPMWAGSRRAEGPADSCWCLYVIGRLAGVAPVLLPANQATLAGRRRGCTSCRRGRGGRWARC